MKLQFDLKDVYSDHLREGYFDEYFGYNCVDLDFVPGKLGQDVEVKVFKALKKQDLYPFKERFLDPNDLEIERGTTAL